MRRLRWLGAALPAVVIAATPALAHATGSYEVSTCNQAAGAVNNSWSWSTSDPAHPSHFAEHTNCPYRMGQGGGTADRESGLSSTDALGLSDGAQPGTSAGWSFTAPSATTITGIEYERYIGHETDPNNSWAPALRADGAVVPGETCLDSVQNEETCVVGGPPGEGGEPIGLGGLAAHQLSVGITCQAPGEDECVTGATLHKVWAVLYGAKVTLEDGAAPTLGGPSGSLWTAPRGLVSGTQSVAVSAQDLGGGVRGIALSVDGNVVLGYGTSCDYTYAQPCPSSTATTLSLPTTQFSDGPHSLRLVATDAAGNESGAATSVIDVENTAALPGKSQPPAEAVRPAEPRAGPSGESGKPRLRLSESLRGRVLVVRVRGSQTGRVQVSVTARLHGRQVGSWAKAGALRQGALTLRFRLGRVTVRRASIRVSARLKDENVVTNTLRRHTG